MNGLLYRWGAVIVSPGYAGPAVDWLDNRPGIETVPSGATAPDAASLVAAEHQGRRLGRLAGIVGLDLEREAKLEF